MTLDDSAIALERIGYTPRQARFLTLVVLHSGFFVRRQYVTFIGRPHGAVTVTFLRELLHRRHAVVTDAPSTGQIYHVTSKAVYAGLGQENNRNRRRHGAANIRRRLMALDFVLAHRDAVILATEQEKVAYFTTEHKVTPPMLPAIEYKSPDTGATTRRCFVEKFPIAVFQRLSRVAFTYIDDDEATADGFTTFLDRYRPLMERLRVGVELIVVTTTAHHVDRAQAVVARQLGGRGDVWSVATLLAYVRARLRLEERALAGAAQQDLDALRRDLASVAREPGDTVYRLWRAHGDAVLEAWVQQQERTARIGAVTVRGVVLPFSYGMPPGARSYRA